MGKQSFRISLSRTHGPVTQLWAISRRDYFLFVSMGRSERASTHGREGSRSEGVLLVLDSLWSMSRCTPASAHRHREETAHNKVRRLSWVIRASFLRRDNRCRVFQMYIFACFSATSRVSSSYRQGTADIQKAEGRYVQNKATHTKTNNQKEKCVFLILGESCTFNHDQAT